MTRTISLAIAVSALGIASTAEAHFNLMTPTNWAQEDPTTFGGPQKSAPCGDRDSGTTSQAVPTNAVTTYKVGDTVTITLQETITHPGHYRVALANDMASLPADPPVTPGSTPCGTTVIETNPTPPLLADGQLQHTTALSGPQTIQVKLPAGMTCDHCVLQVIEFMSNHGLNNPGGCFYHHCATISITPDGTGGGGGGGNPDAGTGGGGGGGKTGGGCAVAGGGAGLLLGLAAIVGLRRRRR